MKKFVLSLMSVSALVVSFAGMAFARSAPPTAVPEPGTMALVGAGVAGLLLYKKIKK